MDGPELSCTALYFTSHHSSKEGQLWRGLQNADGLAGGELAGKVGTGAPLQTPAEPQGSGEESPVPLPVQCGVALHPNPDPATSRALLHTGEEQRHTQHQGEHHITHNPLLEGKIDHLLLWQQELLQTVK